MGSTTNSVSVGFVGLGNIGGAASVNLIEAGFTVRGFDLKQHEGFAQAGGVQVDDLASIARCDVVLQSLPGEGALIATVDGLLPHLRPGQVVIDLSSYDLAVKRGQAERLAAAGVTMLDCEVSGLPHQVTARAATIFKAGDEDTVAGLAQVFDALAAKHFYLGPFGAATRMKLIANTMVCVHNLMAAEALSLGRAAGLDPEAMIEVLGPSAAGSATFTNKAALMIAGGFDGGVGPFRHMFGYLERAQGVAAATGRTAATPLLNAAREVYEQARDEGRHDQDIAAIIEVLNARATEPEGH